MDKYCNECGEEVPERAAFCANCGMPVAPEEAPQRARRTAQSATPPSAARASAPAQTQERPVHTPPQHTPPPGPSGPRRGLILGGLAAVGVLGLLALLVVGALLYFFVLAPRGEAEPQPEPTPQPEPQPEPEPNPEPAPAPQPAPQPQPQPAPQGGPLDSLVRRQVGEFTLQGIGEWPEATQAGATQALLMVYTDTNGTPLDHYLAAYGSPDAAEQALRAGVDGLVSQGYQVGSEFETSAGTYVALQVEVEGTSYNAWLWTEGSLYAIALGLGETAGDFFAEAPYGVSY